MKRKLPIETLLLYIIFIPAVIQITSCKKNVSGVIIYTTPSLPPPSPTVNSSVHFWTRDTFLTTAPTLFIIINNETKILNESWGGTGDPFECCPYCGTVEFKMIPGIYTWKTWRQGRDTIRGTATVIANHCTMEQINY